MALTKCNICLEQNNLLLPVDTAYEDNLTALEKLQIVAPFQDWLGSYTICNICNDSLETSYQFIYLCSKYESERIMLIQEEKEKNNQSKNESNNPLKPDTCRKEEQMEIITIKIEPEIVSLEGRSNKKVSAPEIDIAFPCEREYNHGIDNFDFKESKCIKCNQMFPNNQELGIHMSIDHGFKCKICRKDFRTKGSLGQHIRLEHPKKISCEICGENFSKPKELIGHCTDRHSLKSNEVKPYMCDICQRRFTSWASLTRHHQYHEGTRNYTCKVCGKCFVTKKDVDMHELIHGNEKNFCCKTCGKRFNTLSNLRTHMNCVHLDPSKRKYECYLCSKRFNLKASMEEHIKRHIGLKEHTCLICGASFIAKYDLKRHTYFHTKDRPYKCDFCENKSYRDGKTLKQHIEKCHRVINTE